MILKLACGPEREGWCHLEVALFLRGAGHNQIILAAAGFLTAVLTCTGLQPRGAVEDPKCGQCL